MRKPGDRVGDEYDRARPDVERGAVAHGLGHAERDRDAVDQHQRPEAERDRHGQPLHHEVEYRAVLEVALAEFQPHVVPQHEEEPLVRRLVEPERLLHASDERGDRVLRCRCRTIATTAPCWWAPTPRPWSRCRAPAPGRWPVPPGRRARTAPDEIDDHDPEQRRQDQQEAAKDIPTHAIPPKYSATLAARASSTTTTRVHTSRASLPASTPVGTGPSGRCRSWSCSCRG